MIDVKLNTELMMSPESLSAVDCITAIIDGSGIAVNVWSHRSGDSLAHSADDISDDVHVIMQLQLARSPSHSLQRLLLQDPEVGKKNS